MPGSTHTQTKSTESQPRPEERARRGAEDVVDGVTEVVNASLELVSEIARRSAEATTPRDKRLEPCPADAAPLNAAVRYTVATITNVIEMMGSAIRDAAGGTRSATRPGGVAGPPTRPTVKRGATLRMPLSIENPSATDAEELAFVPLELRFRGTGPGASLPQDSMRFEPEVLKVAPRDFEKLTVFVDVPKNAALGRHEARIGLAGGDFETSIRFDVVD